MVKQTARTLRFMVFFERERTDPIFSVSLRDLNSGIFNVSLIPEGGCILVKQTGFRISRKSEGLHVLVGNLVKQTSKQIGGAVRGFLIRKLIERERR